MSKIHTDSKPFIVAELSANHNGSFKRAIDIIDAAANAGADAVKFQVWEPGTMAFPGYIIQRGPWKGRDLADLYREAFTPWEWLPELFKLARERDLIPFASPFDKASVDYLETLGCPIYKIASFELIDIPLIQYAASKGKPLLISTGMADVMEIRVALDAARGAGATDVTLLRCVSQYPADASEVSLVGQVDGISDHSNGIGVAVAAVARGAKVVEKHLTLSRSDGGLDSGFSMEPAEFAQLVTECRRAAEAVKYKPTRIFDTSCRELRRSVWFRRAVKRGQIITADDICTARPALGISPMDMHKAIGRTLSRDAERGTPMTWDMVV